MARGTPRRQALALGLLCLAVVLARSAPAQQVRVDLNPRMVVTESDLGDAGRIVDEQREIIGPPVGEPARKWEIPSEEWKKFPVSLYVDLGEERNLSSVWLFDTHNHGDVIIAEGSPGDWRDVATYDCRSYLKWAEVPLDVTTRYLRLTLKTPGANFTEIAVYEYTAEAYRALQERKVEEARQEAERQAALERAREEALRRPVIALEPFGRLSLVDEVDGSNTEPEHSFQESPEGASRVETILGRRCRVVPPVSGEASYVTYRVGRRKLLRPGAAYVLAVEYPEDVPRSLVVINTGNETSRGFHTGSTLGDALHSKYVNNLSESLDVPLSGRWETWTLLFHLHDRFPERALVRGPEPRPLTPEDGFDVTVAQFSARDVPASRGIAVATIRLYEVIDPDGLAAPVRFPPDDLPRRRLFWREEMSDGVIAGKKPEERGLENPIDWFRFKAEQMRFLAMNTYSKDLLEFGACQHWDSTPLGGNAWVYHDAGTKHLWAEIVGLMGRCGFDVLPYYEYAGSLGEKGLGNERRAKPLTRDDAYTHVSWIEKANVDITDPATYEDFQKMLELTVLRLRTTARFAGVWLRPRAQIPVGFGEATLGRFSRDVLDGKSVTRERLRADSELYQRYIEWWEGKRQRFLVAMRDYLELHGIVEPVVLFTGCSSEPGVEFHSWEPRLVTDRPEAWAEILGRPEHKTSKGETIRALSLDDVVSRGLYLEALTAPALNWGDWEVHHARPADDPKRYRDTEGALLTHAFNRLYTVSDPRSLEAYRTRTGLAVVRHYALNENMMVDSSDQSQLGYFVADIERAGPYCMLAEAAAMASGDPTMIGYLVGASFGRGFPLYARRFNASFLALPALPSRVVSGACDDPEIVVREISTEAHGTWYALVNVGLNSKLDRELRLAGLGPVHDAVGGSALLETAGSIRASFYPCELKAWHRLPVRAGE